MTRLGSGIPLVARAEQLLRLRAAFDRAAEGSAAAVLIGGDAGVGKTRLVQELCRIAQERPATVLTGHCLDLRDAGLPYLPFAEAFTPLVGPPPAGAPDAALDAVRSRPALARLLPQLAHEAPAAPGSDDRRRAGWDHDLGELQLFDAVLGLLTELGEDVPVVLVLEDLHWADGSTRNLLSFLVYRLRAQRLLIVGTYREEDLHRRHPMRAALTELQRAATVELLELPPFSTADSRAFIEALSEGTADPALVAEVTERSQGNPFFAEELLAARSEGCHLPVGLAEALLSRVERLGARTEQVLRLVSVSDGPVSHAALLEVSGLDELELDESLREAVQHHVLVVDRGHYAFRHALLDEAVYGDLLPGERSRIHRMYAARLKDQPEGRGRDAALAHHSLESNDLVTGLAASRRAAREAEQIGAPAAALRHLEEMLRIWDAVPESDRPTGLDEISLQQEACYFAGTSGEPERAIAYGRAAVAAIGPDMPAERAAELWQQLAEALLGLESTWEEAVSAIDQAWQLVCRAPAGRIRARVLATRAAILRSIDRMEDARWSAEAAVADARASGAEGAEADALITLGALADTNGDIEGSRDLLRRAQRKAQAAGALDVELRARYFMALSYDDRADIPGALASYEEGVAYAAEVGLTWSSYGIELRGRQLTLLYISGAWPDEHDAGQPQRQVSAAAAIRVRASWASILVARGDVAAAERVLADLREQWRTDMWVALSAGTVGSELAFWRGEYGLAAERAVEGIAWIDQVERWLLGGLRLAAIGLHAAALEAERARADGDPDAADRAVALGEQLLEHGHGCLRHGRPRGSSLGPEGLAWQIRLEASASGLYRTADPGLWLKAAEAFDYGAVYEQAMCRWQAAAALLRTGGDGRDPDAAAAELVRAYAVADRLGAGPLRTAVVDLAHRARLELPGTRVRPLQTDGVALTERERDVLEQVALGRTNRQAGQKLYISEKTVSVHLSRAMAKLGASRRAEAVAIAYDRGLLSRDPAPP